MAREYAQNRIAMWNDDDFRLLTDSAQNLYSYLLAHPSTSYAGVADWRPARLQAVNVTWDSRRVADLGGELERAHYIVIDEETEEVVIRSFLRHETMLRNPNLTRAVVKAFNNIQSRMIRAVIAFEVDRLRDQHPDWAGLDLPEMEDIYDTEGLNAKTITGQSDPSPDPWGDPSPDPSESDGTVWAITGNKKQVTDNKKPITLQQSTQPFAGPDDDESIEVICRRQVSDAFKVDYDKVRIEISKACGRVPTPSDIVRVVASIIARSSEMPAKPTAYVTSSIHNNWAEWQQLMDEGVTA